MLNYGYLKGVNGMRTVLNHHIQKFIFRTLLLAVAIFLFFIYNEKLDFTAVLQQGFGGIFLWVIWIILVIEMLYRIFPNTSIAIGARKHFPRSYTATSEAKTDVNDKAAMLKSLNKGVLFSLIGWLVATAAILFVLFPILTPPTVLILMLVFAVLDLAFILFVCPFRVLFMKNHCCVTCRIYNWDYFMMCAPLIIFPSFYSISLTLLSTAVLLRWEVALRKNPHFFTRTTNKNLTCESCEDKTCRKKP